MIDIFDKSHIKLFKKLLPPMEALHRVLDKFELITNIGYTCFLSEGLTGRFNLFHKEHKSGLSLSYEIMEYSKTVIALDIYVDKRFIKGTRLELADFEEKVGPWLKVIFDNLDWKEAQS